MVISGLQKVDCGGLKRRVQGGQVVCTVDNSPVTGFRWSVDGVDAQVEVV